MRYVHLILSLLLLVSLPATLAATSVECHLKPAGVQPHSTSLGPIESTVRDTSFGPTFDPWGLSFGPTFDPWGLSFGPTFDPWG